MDTNTLTAQVVATDTRGRRISPRRHRPIEEKQRLLAESQAPGASVAEVALRHGVNANLLFVWRRLAERGLLATHTRRGSGRRLVPVKRWLALPAVVRRPADDALAEKFQ